LLLAAALSATTVFIIAFAVPWPRLEVVSIPFVHHLKPEVGAV
jgi:hypothetical protein